MSEYVLKQARNAIKSLANIVCLFGPYVWEN